MAKFTVFDFDEESIIPTELTTDDIECSLTAYPLIVEIKIPRKKLAQILKIPSKDGYVIFNIPFTIHSLKVG